MPLRCMIAKGLNKVIVQNRTLAQNASSILMPFGNTYIDSQVRLKIALKMLTEVYNFGVKAIYQIPSL